MQPIQNSFDPSITLVRIKWGMKYDTWQENKEGHACLSEGESSLFWSLGSVNLLDKGPATKKRLL